MNLSAAYEQKANRFDLKYARREVKKFAAKDAQIYMRTNYLCCDAVGNEKHRATCLEASYHSLIVVNCRDDVQTFFLFFFLEINTSTLYAPSVYISFRITSLNEPSIRLFNHRHPITRLQSAITCT